MTSLLQNYSKETEEWRPGSAAVEDDEHIPTFFEKHVEELNWFVAGVFAGIAGTLWIQQRRLRHRLSSAGNADF